MHEVSTSRRAVMRALAIIPSIIATPAIAAPALVCTTVEAGDQRWLALLANERRLAAAFEEAVDVQNHAEDRFYDLLESAEADWQKRFDARRRLPGCPRLPGESDDALEIRVQAMIREWNAGNQAMRNERDGIADRVGAEVGLPEARNQWETSCNAQTKALKEIVAYPTRDPDKIAHKLQMIIDRYGDDNGDLEPLLASIVGGVA